MTRDEVKGKHILEIYENSDTGRPDMSDVNRVVDEIYNDFENRTCSTCGLCDDAYFGAYTGQRYKCNLGYGNINKFGTIFTEAKFGCNKWESKND